VLVRCIYVLCIILTVKSIYSPTRKTLLFYIRETLCVQCQIRPANLYTRPYLDELYASNVCVNIFRARSYPCVMPIKISVRPSISLSVCVNVTSREPLDGVLNFMFEFPYIISLYYIKNQQDVTLTVLFISNCKITLHVSDASRVNHQEY